MRLLISASGEQPLAWKVSKVENVQPVGILKLTVAQDKFNLTTDYVDLGTKEAYADYYDGPDPVTPKDAGKGIVVTAATSSIMANGSYKKITADTAEQCTWKCEIDGEDLTGSQEIKWLNTGEPNTVKLKLIGRDRMGDMLVVKCETPSGNGSVTLTVTA